MDRPPLPDGVLMTGAAASPASSAAPRFEPALMRRKLTGTLFYGLCLAAIAILILALIALLLNVLVSGIPWLSADFLTGVPSRRPANAGIWPALIGSIEIAIMVAALTFPLGIGAAVYLAEYAPDNWFTRLMQTNISNLAGVPSIIYGIFGLAIFVRLLGFGPVLFSGAATLALVILPLVIIASIEALKAVPQGQREGAYALGASRWQMVKGSVLPAAAPGIMTGIILAMARAIGEAAPLVVIGAATFVLAAPQPFAGGFSVLPIQIFNWAQRPQEDFHGLAAATIIVVLVLIFILNLLALIVRARLSRHIQW
jgi:phosphate transport system permease protein